MNDDSNKNDVCEGHDIFEVWKEYERIAMHFNELIIQLRVRALGGIAAISALVGFLSKGDTPEDFRWGIFAAVFGILIIVWIAIIFLDILYYDRLLKGSVTAIVDVEKESETKTKIKHFKMSHMIERSVQGKTNKIKEGFFSGRRWFYGLVLAALVISFYFSLAEHCYKSSKDSVANIHGICRLTIHWGKSPDIPDSAQ